MKIVAVFLLLILGIRECSGCISVNGLRNVIRKANRAGRNFPDRPIQSPIYLNLSDDEATSDLLSRKPSLKIMTLQSNVTTPSTTSNSTVSASPFDDPLFVPGDFLDSEGKTKFASEVPIEDLMSKFVQITNDKISGSAWKIVLLLLAQIGVSIAFIILYVKSLSAMSLYKTAKAPLKKLDEPKSREDNEKDKKVDKKQGKKRKPVRMKQGIDPEH